jgi:hypothetical protein
VIKCKHEPCDFEGDPEMMGFCSAECRDYDGYETEIKGLEREIMRLRDVLDDAKQALRSERMAYERWIHDLKEEAERLREEIQDHYDVWQTSNEPMRQAGNRALWLAIGIGEMDAGVPESISEG